MMPTAENSDHKKINSTETTPSPAVGASPCPTSAHRTTNSGVNSTATTLAAAEATAAVSVSSSEDSQKWLQSLNSVIPAIVVIRVLKVRAFDGRGASYSKATGFVIDKKNGYILTNRHVVNSGPIVADAIFINKEEVPLKPIYRDPVHDFGVCQFEPSAIKFLDLVEIHMAPQEAKIGMEIRVVGNDAGEKLSILPGILAKMDRDAPNYGSSGYNDFNTFYYAAASSTSGGSFGSPVLNIHGHAIALNAGGAKVAASSYYLPLDRVVRALHLMQQEQARLQAGQQQQREQVTQIITRGTIQTIWKHYAFDEVRRLGLSAENEKLIRETYPKETGMLVVDQVVPSSCAYNILHAGDILIKFNGIPQTTFIPMEDHLDTNVNNDVDLEIERGGKLHKFSFKIQDLHSITPNRFLEVSDSILHSLSYQQARNADLPVGSVYAVKAGHMMAKAGIPCPCIITAVGNEPTPTLDDFIDVVSKISTGTRTTIRYFLTGDRHRIRTVVFTMDRQWFPMQIFTRNDFDGLWHVTQCAEPMKPFAIPKIPETPPAPLSLSHAADFHGGKNGGSHRIKNCIQALVLVSFDIPYLIDGVSSSHYKGVGIILDKTNGFVLVDRNTVPTTLGDVLITVSASIEIPGVVVFVHPIHNFSILSYDPKLLGPTSVEQITLSDNEMMIGMTLDFVGLTHNFTVITQRPCITKLDRCTYRLCQPPRYRATNVEVVHFDKVTKSVGGVFLDENGHVMCLWLSFSYQDERGAQKDVYRGLPVKIIRDIISEFRNGNHLPGVMALTVELLTCPLSKARSGMGLSDNWAYQLEQCHDDRRQVMAVKRCSATMVTPNSSPNKIENTAPTIDDDNNDLAETKAKLETGDIILSIDGNIISRDWDVEEACRNKQQINSMTVLRNHTEIELNNVLTTNLPTIGTDRIIIWSGMVLQSPHYEVISIGYLPKEGGGVYCSRWYHGSPAHKYGLHATIWIIEVNGIPTPTLDEFLSVVQKCAGHESVRLKTRDLNTKIKVYTLKTDYHYWPSIEIRRNHKTNLWGRNLIK